MEPINLIISSTTFATDLYFKLRGIKSKKEKLLVAINRIYPDVHNRSIAVNISISNIGDKPFSIIEIFFEQNGQYFSACEIKKINTTMLSDGSCDLINFESQMLGCTFEPRKVENITSLYSFNQRAFLQPNQAESGWILFPINKEKNVNNIIIKISGESEIFINNI